MGFVKHIIVLSALFVAASALAQVDPERVVVRVNGTAIHGHEYYKRMEIQHGLGSVGPNKRFVPMYPGYLTLRWLIEEELLIQLAESKGLAPSDAQVEADLQLRLESNADQVRELLKLGFKEADLKRRVLVDLSEFNVITEGVTITDFEVEKHYTDNILRYTLQKRYRLHVIRITGDEAKKKVDDALSSGTSFADVARAQSSDISKFNGGDLGVIADGSLLPSTRTQVSKTRKGGVTDWIDIGDESARFMVEDIFEQKVFPLDTSLKATIRKSLMRTRGQAKNNLPLMMVEFRQTVKLEFSEFPFAEEIKQHFSTGG